MTLAVSRENTNDAVSFQTRTLIVMKLTIALLFVFTFQVSANGPAAKITIVKKNASLTEVFKAIEQQTGFIFLYDKEVIQHTEPVDIALRNATLEKTLSVCLKDHVFTYSIMKNSVLIKSEEKTTYFKSKATLPSAEAPEPPPVELKGKVVNGEGVPLQGASVVVSGTKNGTTTNNDGRFTLTVPNGENIVLEISSVGYQTQRVNVAKQTDVNVTLELEVSGLSDVVVTALGIKRETRSLVYATQNVKPKEMIDIQDPNNFLNAFQGKIANALITQSLGGVGSSSSIILRGDRSIQGSNDALIVIDGVPNSATSTVNPNDIESVTVLRGASAGALYGSQAGNGVIIITTKKGNAKGDVLVNLNSGVVLNSAYALPPMQNTYGQGSGGVLDAKAGSSWGAKMDEQAYTDYKGNPNTYSAQPNNVKDFFNSGINLNNSLSVSGGSEKVQGYLSYVNNSTKGIVPTNNLMSHNVNLKVTTQIGKRISVEGNFNYLTQKIKDEYISGPVLRLLQIPRNVSHSYVRDFEEIDINGLPAPSFWTSPDKVTYQNPYWTLYRNTQPANLEQVRGYLKVRYQITNWLNVTGNANLSKAFNLQDHKIWNGTYFNPSKAGGTFIRTNTTAEQQWFDIIFDGTNNITKDFKINYQFGAIYKDNTNNLDIFTASGLNVPNKFSLNYATTSIMSSASTEIQTQSVFGQVNFSFKNFLFLDASLRNDWSSLLPAPHSFQYYSVGASAILSSLFKLPETISYLKTSINYAEVGNGGQFGLLTSTYSYRAGAGNGYLLRSPVLPFPNLKPEIVKNLELNAAVRLLHDRLNFELTYYQSNSFNQLINIETPPATGYGSKYINAGNIRNRGVELTLGGTPVKSRDFTWDIDLNFSLNRNKVIKLSDNLKTIYLDYFSSNTVTTQVTEGGAYGDIYSNYWLQNTKGEYLVNSNGLPSTSDKAGNLGKVIGNFNPREMIGMTNTFNYKQFSLRLLLDGRIGGEVVSGVDMDLVFDGGPAVTEKYRQGGWNLNGVDATGSKVTSTVSAQDFWQWVSSKRYGVGEFFSYDATNIRVREVALGYGIPLSGKLFIKSARVSLVARNLLFLYRGSSKLDIPGLGTRKMWFDPDMTGGGVQGQFGYLPSTRAIGINLNVNF
ncbi:MAG: SusC/RagA family TonB-linked outer membrane protein [Chitinophagaceae bacterium]